MELKQVLNVSLCHARSCCIDKKPQQMDLDRAALLCNFAELVVREMEMEWAARQQRAQSLKLLRTMDAYKQAFMFVDVSAPQWRVLYLNDHAIQNTGKTPASYMKMQAI